MRVGVLRETKDRELRVALQPSGARALVEHGHEVRVERGAGRGSGFADSAYEKAGALLVGTPAELIEGSELVVKVKEPTESELDAMYPGQAIFSYLHLAPDPKLVERLLEKEITAIGYETVEADDGTLPLLVPMSEVAGRLSVQIGAHCLQADQGGRGVLLGGVPGVPRGRVTVIGAGVVGTAAVRVAVGLGAEVDVLDIDHRRLSHLHDIYQGTINTLYSNRANIELSVLEADIVVGAVLRPGARAPILVSRELVRRMRNGSVIVDVAVDQGGCVETIHATTHSDPTYVVDGVIHYGVANMPGAVPRTSTFALTNATFGYLQELCDRGVVPALLENPMLARAVLCYGGDVTHRAVAEAQDRTFVEAPWKVLAGPGRA